MSGASPPGRRRHPGRARDEGMRRIAVWTRGTAVGGLALGVGIAGLLAYEAPGHSAPTAAHQTTGGPATGGGSGAQGPATGGGSGATRGGPPAPASQPPLAPPGTAQHAPVVSGGS